MKITPDTLIKTGGNKLAYDLKRELMKNAEDSKTRSNNLEIFQKAFDAVNKIYFNTWKLSTEVKGTIDEYEKFIPLLDNCGDFLRTLMQTDILETITGYLQEWQKPDAKLPFTNDEYFTKITPSFKFFALFNDILPIKDRTNLVDGLKAAAFLKQSLDTNWNETSPDISFSSIISSLDESDEVKNFNTYKFNSCY